MSSSVNFTVTGSSNSSSLVDGNGTITTSAAASNLSGKFYDGSVFGCCNFNEDNLGIGPCFFICHFKLSPEYTEHLYLNDASWVEYVSLARSARTRAGQELTAKTGVDVLTSVHYSAHGYDISNAGNALVYDASYIRDFSNTGVLHVTHIYPSALDAYYVWAQQSNNMASGRNYVLMQPWSLTDPSDQRPLDVPSREHYISIVNCPKTLLPKFQAMLNENNGYSRMMANGAISETSGNLFRFNTTSFGVYRPEMAREGVFSELPPVAIDGSGNDDITPANAYTGGALPAVPGVMTWTIDDTIADIKLALPHMAAKVKDAVPPLANIQKL